jgi:hypothetical protein
MLAELRDIIVWHRSWVAITKVELQFMDRGIMTAIDPLTVLLIG